MKDKSHFAKFDITEFNLRKSCISFFQFITAINDSVINIFNHSIKFLIVDKTFAGYRKEKIIMASNAEAENWELVGLYFLNRLIKTVLVYIDDGLAAKA